MHRLRKRSSLKTRLVLLATVAVAAMSGAMLATVGYVARREVHAAVKDSSSRAETALKVLVKHRQDTLVRLASLLADLPVIRSVTQTVDTPTINEAAKHYHELAEAGWIVVTDASGKYLGGAGPDGKPVEGWEPGPSIKSAAEGKPTGGSVKIGGTVAMAATAPIKVGDYTQGTLTIGFPIDNALANEISQTANTDIAFVAGDAVVGSSLPLTSANGVERLTKPSIVVNGHTYSASMSELPGDWGGAGLKFVSLLDTANVERPFNSIQRVLTAIFGTSLLMAFAVGYGLATRLTKPLEGLVAAAQELRAGRWPESIPTKRHDEIGILQTVFGEMVTSLRSSQEALLEMVQIDPLTRLANHNTFRDRLASAVLVAQTSNRPLSLVILDLDNFEEFNVKHGRNAGDVALVAVADILRSRFGGELNLARFAGNQFAIISADESAQDTLVIIECVLEEIQARTGSTASAGLAENGESTPRPDLLVLAADLAVQQAKLAGKNRCRIYAGDVTATSVDDLKSFLQGGSYSAVRALAEAVDAKDQYTRGHSQRVAEYARDLAHAAGYDAGFVELVYTTGTLHDVGKIGVPDSVLHKNGRLDDEEFAAIKLHPELGEKIVMQIATLRETLPGIRHHHERYDGKGYPDELAGEDIPLIARILAVADTFDAMTSDRPYRNGLALGIALGEIEKNAGTQFDPELARIFVEIKSLQIAA